VRIVLDTNVLVAGLLSPFGMPGQIVRLVSSGELSLCLDARILSEYEEVLSRPKFGFDADATTALLDYIAYRGEMVAASPLADALPDPDDEPFLEVAFASAADYLVTGNHAHFPPHCCAEFPVVSPAEFMDAYRRR
jgi:putative PIN family toxin of toxin-antitoxin system